MSPSTEGEKKGFGQRKLKHPLLTALVIIVSFIALISFFVSSDQDSKKTETQQAVNSASTPEEKIKAIVANELKGQNSNKQDRLRQVAITPTTEAGESFIIRVVFNADENLTSNLKKQGIELQMAKLYQQLYTNKLPINRIVIQAYTNLVDQYGNEHDTEVFETFLNKDEADKINWTADTTTLQMQIIPGVWTVSYVHPIYRKQHCDIIVILDVIEVVAYDVSSMQNLKKVSDLPEAQQKALFTILRMKKPAVRTSEVHENISGNMTGRSVGAVLGSLYRNGYLEKVQGGRDKMWKLSDNAEGVHNELKQAISKVKVYWS